MLSNEFMGGFISACGTFLEYNRYGRKYFAFQIKSPLENAGLLNQIAASLQLYNHVYTFSRAKPPYSLLLIRSRHSIISNIMPFLDQYLDGAKRAVYEDWKIRFWENCSTWNYRNVTSPGQAEKYKLVDKKPNSI